MKNRLTEKEKRELKLFQKECRKTDYEFKKKAREETLSRILWMARGFYSKKEPDTTEFVLFKR